MIRQIYTRTLTLDHRFLMLVLAVAFGIIAIATKMHWLPQDTLIVVNWDDRQKLGG